jgi:hypothetical protein
VIAPSLRFVASLVCAGLLGAGCAAPNDEGFAIYLTRDDIAPDKMEVLSHVEIAGQPIVSMGDIISYNGDTHAMVLTDEALERISRLQVPVRGKSFLVCVDRAPLYWGAFWTPISSISFDGVAIQKPLAEAAKMITLDLGYPSEALYRGDDPRTNAEVRASLQRAGKLVTPSGAPRR